VLQKNQSISATIGVATGTSALAVDDNLASRQRRRSPESLLAADPLPPPRQQAPPLDGDDAPRPHDLHLILRLTITSTVSVSHCR
jgi:hypothetical protein